MRNNFMLAGSQPAEQLAIRGFWLGPPHHAAQDPSGGHQERPRSAVDGPSLRMVEDQDARGVARTSCCEARQVDDKQGWHGRRADESSGLASIPARTMGAQARRMRDFDTASRPWTHLSTCRTRVSGHPADHQAFASTSVHFRIVAKDTVTFSAPNFSGCLAPLFVH